MSFIGWSEVDFSLNSIMCGTVERVRREEAVKKHQVENIRIENGILSLIVDGNSIERKLGDVSSLLAAAKPEELKTFEVSPSGYGIHWPLIDEDISIDGLLGIRHAPDSNRKSA